jgi:hypothetical protein
LLEYNPMNIKTIRYLLQVYLEAECFLFVALRKLAYSKSDQSTQSDLLYSKEKDPMNISKFRVRYIYHDVRLTIQTSSIFHAPSKTKTTHCEKKLH